MELQMLELYKSYDIQWFNDVPFETVEKLDEHDGIVTFTTEWPVRELCCTTEEWQKRFYPI